MSCSADTANDILLQSRPRACKAGSQGSENGIAVSSPTSFLFHTHFANLHIPRSSTEAFTQAYRSAYQSIQSGGAGNVLSRVRNMGTAEMVGVGIVGAELIGFFTVGEILGRFKVVGYRGGKHGDEAVGH
jgi:hypothetical protein